jgi:hypothetical protein
MKKSYFKFPALLLLLLLIKGCRVYNDMRTGLRPDSTFFSKKHVGWLAEAADTANDDPYARQIRSVARQSLEEALVKKGYLFCEDSATVYLKLQVANEEGEELISLPPQTWPNIPLIYRCVESSLILTVHDAETMEMLWAGTICGRLYSDKQIHKGVVRAVRDMMQNYPPYTPLPFDVIYSKDEIIIKTLSVNGSGK